jgi:hypothetical protein
LPCCGGGRAVLGMNLIWGRKRMRVEKNQAMMCSARGALNE